MVEQNGAAGIGVALTAAMWLELGKEKFEGHSQGTVDSP